MEKKYILSDYSVIVFEDIYKEFIFGEWLKSPRTNRDTRKIHSSKVFTKNNEKIEKTYNSIESLIKDMNKIMRMRVNGLQYTKQDFDWQIDKGYIKTDVLVDEDLEPPFSTEYEAWTKGRYNLYNAHYRFNVRIGNEYAKGGNINEFNYSIGGL